MIALVFVVLKYSLQWRGEFHLYLDPVPEYLLARWFLMAAGVEGKFLFDGVHWFLFGGAGIWADK